MKIKNVAEFIKDKNPDDEMDFYALGIDPMSLFIGAEIPFRLTEMFDYDEDNLDPEMVVTLVNYFLGNSDIMFDYDGIDSEIEYQIELWKEGQVE